MTCLICPSKAQDVSKEDETNAVHAISKSSTVLGIHDVIKILFKLLSVDESLAVPQNLSLKDKTFCLNCYKFIYEICEFHREVERIQIEITNRLKQVRENFNDFEVWDESDRGCLSKEFRYQFRRGLKSRQQNQSDVSKVERELCPLLLEHIDPISVESDEIKTNLTLSSPFISESIQIKVQPVEFEEEDVEQDGFLASLGIIDPLQPDEDDKEMIDFDETNFNATDEDEDGYEISSLGSITISPLPKPKVQATKRELRPRRFQNKTNNALEFKNSLLKEELQSDNEDIDETNNTDLDPDVSFSEGVSSSDNESDSVSELEEDWKESPNKKARISKSNSSSPEVKNKRIRIRNRHKTDKQNIGEKDMVFKDGKIFYEGIEITKEKTDQGHQFTCGECKRIVNVNSISMKNNRESLYYRIKVHIRGVHKGQFSCHICSKEMTTSKGLKKHLALHTKDKKSLGEKDLVFKDEKIFYEGIEITKEKTDQGYKFTCGECQRIININLAGLSNRESLYYRIKVHIRGVHKGEFFCHICSKEMTTSKGLRKHVLRHAEDRKCTICPICLKPFKSPPGCYRSLNTHLWSHKSEEEKEAAIAAGEKAPLTYAERSALSVLINEGKFECNECDKSFIWKAQLTKHKQRVHTLPEDKEKDIQCPKCGKFYSTKVDLTTHLKLVCNRDKLARQFMCTFCPKKFNEKNNYERHVSTHTNMKLYSCSKCEKYYSSEKTLKLHLKDCNGLSKNTSYEGVEIIYLENESGFNLRCGCCDFTKENLSEKNKGEAYRRMHLHIKGKHLLKYKCFICSKQLSEPKTLKYHMRSVHSIGESGDNSGVKFHCDICRKPFKSERNAHFVKFHYWSHLSLEEKQEKIDSGETPPKTYAERMKEIKDNSKETIFQCEQCGKTFDLQGKLARHLKKVHNDKDRNTHQCSTCGKFYVTADGLNSHIKHVHEKDKVHKWHHCPHCEKKFSQKFAWTKHLRSHQRKNKSSEGKKTRQSQTRKQMEQQMMIDEGGQSSTNSSVASENGQEENAAARQSTSVIHPQPHLSRQHPRDLNPSYGNAFNPSLPSGSRSSTGRFYEDEEMHIFHNVFQ